MDGLICMSLSPPDQAYPPNQPHPTRPSSNVGRNVAIGCGVGCGGLILLAIVAVVASALLMTPAQRAEMNKRAEERYAADQAARKTRADALFKSLSDLRQRLPDDDHLSEQRAAQPCVPAPGIAAPYMAVDKKWFQQFTDHGFVPARPAPHPIPWYRDEPFQSIEAAAVPTNGMHEPDYVALLGNADSVHAASYIAVIQPLEQRWPVLGSDGRSFQGGVFSGWLILLDGKTEKLIGETRFTAGSSDEVNSLRVGVRSQMLLGDDLKTAMEKDFLEHFWQAADASVTRICRQDAKPDFAAHEG